MRPGNSRRRWADAAGQLNSMLCSDRAEVLFLRAIVAVA
jgi:hypothetical protein